MKYQVPEESSVFACESPTGAVSLDNENVQKVNLVQMMSEGYMTLAESKAMIEKKIHEHFHSRCK